jgi:hypothetical protein
MDLRVSFAVEWGCHEGALSEWAKFEYAGSA